MNETLANLSGKITNLAKTKIYDIIALAMITAMFFVGLGALDIIEFSAASLLEFIINFIPFYLATILLNQNYYTKGTYVGKESTIYSQAIAAYSEQTDKIDGDMQRHLPDFVDWYNEDALRRLQISILKRASIPYSRFAEITYDADGNELKPLITYSLKELINTYGKFTAHIIIKARQVRVQHISVNILMSNVQSIDATNLGKNEYQLRRSRLAITDISSFVSVVLLSMIGLKDVMEWGWLAAFITLFKMVFIAAKSYQMYFKAYGDITVNVVNHIARKTDIIKQFLSWYDKEIAPEKS